MVPLLWRRTGEESVAKAFDARNNPTHAWFFVPFGPVASTGHAVPAHDAPTSPGTSESLARSSSRAPNRAAKSRLAPMRSAADIAQKGRLVSVIESAVDSGTANDQNEKPGD